MALRVFKKAWEGVKKQTSIGTARRKTKTSSMNKGRRRSFKRYRGQGR